MKTMKYIMFPHFIIVEKRLYKSYGVIAIQNYATLIVKDVSMDKSAVKQLVKSLNEQQIKLNHLEAVLNNFFDQ